MISEELTELRQDLNRIKLEIFLVKRDLAWNRVIDDAIRVCRLLRKVETADSQKLNPNWHLQPRVPKRQDGAGQWAGGVGRGDVHLIGGQLATITHLPANNPSAAQMAPTAFAQATLKFRQIWRRQSGPRLNEPKLP